MHPSEIPGIDLYMDQVTTFMDSHLNTSKWLGEDKILTKTMINNYAKNKLLPPPEKKKYTKEQIMEFYINDISFANTYYGLQAAARGYFGKDADELSLSQTAYLCAIPNSPTYYNP